METAARRQRVRVRAPLDRPEHLKVLSSGRDDIGVGLVRWALPRIEGLRRCRHVLLGERRPRRITNDYFCEECLLRGDTWHGLRVCRSCGHIGCCERSALRHADAHFQLTRHPIVDAIGPQPMAQRSWAFCYLDQIRFYA